MSITKDIRKLELELIDVETRLNSIAMLGESYSVLQEKRNTLVKQLDYLKQQQLAISATVVQRASQPRGPTQSEIVKNRVAELQKADPDRSMEDVFDQVAEELGKTVDAVKASNYRKPKTKSG